MSKSPQYFSLRRMLRTVEAYHVGPPAGADTFSASSRCAIMYGLYPSRNSR